MEPWLPHLHADPRGPGRAARPRVERRYQKISFPAFTPVFGTDVAYIGSGAAEVADDQAVIDKLLAQGYALTGVGYSRQGWSTPEAVQANELMIRHINAGAVKGAKKIMVWGESFGALVAATVAERNPTKVAGLLPTCGVLAGPEQAMNTAMTVLYSWKTLVAPEPAGGQLHQLRPGAH